MLLERPAARPAVVGNARSPTRLEFRQGAFFTRDESVSISVDPTNTPNDVNLTCFWVYDLGT